MECMHDDSVAIEIDLFQRTCIRKGSEQPEEEEEIEIESSGREPYLEEEECQKEEEGIDRNALLAELDCLRSCILKMQLKIKELEKEQQKTELVPLTCAEKKEVCDLQKAHHKIQCHINELIRCFALAKEYLREMRLHMCDKVKEIEQLVEYIELLEFWKVTLAPEFGVCKKRYEYLKCAKAEWSEFLALIEKRKINCEALADKYVTLKAFLKEKAVVATDINRLKIKISTLYKTQKERFVNVENRLKAILASGLLPRYVCTDKPTK